MTKEQFFISVALCMAALALYTTSQNVNPTQGPAAPSPGAEIMQHSISDIQTKLDKLKSDVDDLGKNVLSLDAMSTALFTPTSTGFRSVTISGLGPYAYLLVGLENVEKFGDGYKLTFSFGNPTSMTISALKGKITLLSNNQTKEFELLSNLEPGAWNNVPIIVGPATEKAIGVIVIGDLNTNNVRLKINHLPN